MMSLDEALVDAAIVVEILPTAEGQVRSTDDKAGTPGTAGSVAKSSRTCWL
jgi:hypothetical protein